MFLLKVVLNKIKVMKIYLHILFIILVYSFSYAQLSDDQQKELEQREGIENTNNEQFSNILKRTVLHIDEVLLSITKLYNQFDNKTEATDILEMYAKKLKKLIPELNYESLLQFEVTVFNNWLVKNPEEIDKVPAVLELFAVAESDLFLLTQ